MKKLFTLALAVVLIAVMAVIAAANPDAGYSITASRGTPVVDGVKDDIWDTAEVQTQDRIRNGTDTGTHVAIRFLYDDDNLYLLAEVPDSTIWTKDLSLASMTYNMDGAEICLSLSNNPATSIDTATDAWVGVTPYGDFYSSQANWLVGSGAGVSSDNEEFDAEFMEIHTSLENDPDNETANPYYIEAVWHIKAYDAQYAPAEGVTYGFEISYNDNAAYENRTMCIGWSDISDAASSNPSVWGQIVLGGEAVYKAVGDVAVPYATPEIDGVINPGEYPEAGKVVLNQSNLTALGWIGEVPAANSIDLYCAWDNNNFYIAGEVTDPAFMYSDYGQYNGDAFQVSLNIGNVFKSDEYQRAIFYSWGLTEEGTIDVIRQESANDDTIFEIGRGQKTDKGWCFEVPLSLEMLADDAYQKGAEEAIPEPGMPIGGLFCYLDHDDIGSLVNAFGTSTDEVMGWDPDAHGITFLFQAKDGAAAAPAASGEVPAVGTDAAAKMFTDFENYAAFEMKGDPVFTLDDPADVAEYWTGEWNGPGDTGDEKTVEIVDGVGLGGSKGLAVSSNGTENVGLYLYSTANNNIPKSYPGANYLRVWMDLSSVGFRKANFGVVNSLSCLFTTDEVDAAWDCPFWYSPDGVNWTEMAHGGDGCFGDAQDSDVFGFKGWFAFPVKDFTIRSKANWEGYDEQTPCDPADVWGVYLFWDYSDNYIDEQGNAFILDNIEFVGDYTVFTYDIGGGSAEAAAEEPAAPTYPSSGADGDIINGTVIGNAEGWGGNADAGAAAAFDGNPATFFDPLGVGDGFCGIDAGESYILDKVVILSRADWNARFPGAMIQGSNDGENWTTLWTSDVEGTNPDYYTVTEFENNTGYSQFRYFNETNHGDVAEVEFYGKPGSAAPAPGFGTADEAVASIGKTAISGYTFTEGSNGNNNEGPENIWDGDTATKFCTGEFPISSVAELDDWYKIDGIVMATANDNAEYNGRLPSAWTVSGSPDGENWTVIASGDESFFEESNFRYFAGDASSDAIKFVKFDADGASSGCFQISELVLTGSKTAAPAADEALDAKEEAPNTFDFGVIAAIAAVVSLGGFAVAKKKH